MNNDNNNTNTMQLFDFLKKIREERPVGIGAGISV